MNSFVNGFVKLFVLVGVGSNDYKTPIEIAYKIVCTAYAYFMFSEFARVNIESIIFQYFETYHSYNQFVYLCLCLDVFALYLRNLEYREKAITTLSAYLIWGENGIHLFWLSRIFTAIVYPAIKISYNLVFESNDTNRVLSTNLNVLVRFLLVIFNSYIINLFVKKPI